MDPSARIMYDNPQFHIVIETSLLLFAPTPGQQLGTHLSAAVFCAYAGQLALLINVVSITLRCLFWEHSTRPCQPT
jgi:hypothetical protein